MSILFSYHGNILGSLTFDEKNYCYNSVPEGEAAAKQMSFGLIPYRLYNSQELKSDKLFDEFKVWLHYSSRNDVKYLCEINELDSDWDKLVKMAKHELKSDGFSLKLAQ